MRAIPLSIGPMHFIGIGGIGMSGIAEILHNLGYRVQGSDRSDSANVARLRELGIPVAIGHDAGNIRGCQVVVISAAVGNDNPELVSARQQLIPVVRRADMLGELMRLKWSIAVGGTHGKTTTTSLVAKLLDTAGLDPTVVNGGIINAYGTNARLGSGDWLVAEADESDGSFVKLPALIGVITNMDPEHLDFYGSFDAQRRAFETFVENIPFYGFAALCIDHPEVQAMIPRVADRRVVTYGFSPQADIRAVDLAERPDGAAFAVAIEDRHTGESRRLDSLFLPVPGRHNVANALAAVAIGHEMGVPDAVIRRAFAEFTGVKRRFTHTGTVAGIRVIDDYGHHPVEIAATLRAARATGPRRIVAVVQPHRYSRLSDLFEDFCTCLNDADRVVVAPVYAAGEEPIEGISRDALAAGLRRHGHRGVRTIDDRAELAPLIANLAGEGDTVLCLGAGSITHWANALPGELAGQLGLEAAAEAGA